MADCPCKEGKIKAKHKNGIYIKPYVKPCDDCSKKTSKKTYTTNNIRSRKFK